MTPRGDPARFRTAVTMPADFDAFWRATLAEAEEIDPVTRRTPFPHRSTDELEVSEISFDSWDGIRISGWYCRPARLPADGVLPGLLVPPGYISEPAIPKDWALKGYAALALATRGKLRSSNGFNPGFPGLLTHNIPDRDTYAYRGMYVDVWRAVEVLAGLAEVDADRIGVVGGSQGGALSIVAAALRPDRVTCAVAGAPYLACFPESAALSVSWPYRELVDLLREHPDRADAVWGTTAYFDLVNFAPRVRAPVLMHLGLADDICPPESGYATFAALGGHKELRVVPNAGHEAGWYWLAEPIDRYLAHHLEPTPAVRAPGATSRGRREPEAALSPAPVEAYWEAVDAELAATTPAPALEVSTRLSSPAARVSMLRLTAPGHTRLTGYLSVPSGKGPFPGLLVTPRYGSVNNPPHPFDQERYVTLVINHRGQRLSNVPWQASYPGLLVDRIGDPARYVMRAIAADCLRAMDALTGLAEVDPARIGVTGGDLALIVAARRPAAVMAVALTEPLLLYRLVDAAERSDAYPWEELNDELRRRPDALPAIEETLGYFDLAALAADVRADVLLPLGDPGSIGGPEWYGSLLAALKGRVETPSLTHYGAIDQDAVDAWISGRLGVPPRPRGWETVA